MLFIIVVIALIFAVSGYLTQKADREQLSKELDIANAEIKRLKKQLERKAK